MPTTITTTLPVRPQSLPSILPDTFTPALSLASSPLIVYLPRSSSSPATMIDQQKLTTLLRNIQTGKYQLPRYGLPQGMTPGTNPEAEKTYLLAKAVRDVAGGTPVPQAIMQIPEYQQAVIERKVPVDTLLQASKLIAGYERRELSQNALFSSLRRLMKLSSPAMGEDMIRLVSEAKPAAGSVTSTAIHSDKNVGIGGFDSESKESTLLHGYTGKSSAQRLMGTHGGEADMTRINLIVGAARNVLDSVESFVSKRWKYRGNPNDLRGLSFAQITAHQAAHPSQWTYSAETGVPPSIDTLLAAGAFGFQGGKEKTAGRELATDRPDPLNPFEKEDSGRDAGKSWDRDKPFVYEGKDDERLRQGIEAMLGSDLIQQDPKIRRLLEGAYSHPAMGKMLAHYANKTGNAALLQGGQDQQRVIANLVNSRKNTVLREDLLAKAARIVSSGGFSPSMLETIRESATKVGYQKLVELIDTYSDPNFFHSDERGVALSASDMAYIERQHPREAKLLSSLIGGGSSSPNLSDPRVRERVAQLPYAMGAILRTIKTADQAQRMGVPLAQSHLYPFVTEMSALAYKLENGGVLDPMALHTSVQAAMLGVSPDVSHARLSEIAGVRLSNKGRLQTQSIPHFSQNRIFEGMLSPQELAPYFENEGAGVGLEGYERRLEDLLRQHTQGQASLPYGQAVPAGVDPLAAHQVKLSPEQVEHYQGELAQVQRLRGTLHDPAFQLQAGHYLNIVHRAATGKPAIDQSIPKESDEPQPYQRFMAPFNNQYREGARTLGSIEEVVDALQGGISRLQGFGTIESGEIDRVLTSLGQEPSQFWQGPMRALTPGKAYHTAHLARQFPGEEKDLLAQFTRAPFQEGQTVAFMGGMPGFTDETRGTRGVGLEPGTVGTLAPIQSGVPFGLTQTYGMFKRYATFTQEEYNRHGVRERKENDPFFNKPAEPMAMLRTRDGRQVPVRLSQVSDLAAKGLFSTSQAKLDRTRLRHDLYTSGSIEQRQSRRQGTDADMADRLAAWRTTPQGKRYLRARRRENLPALPPQRPSQNQLQRWNSQRPAASGLTQEGGANATSIPASVAKAIEQMPESQEFLPAGTLGGSLGAASPLGSSNPGIALYQQLQKQRQKVKVAEETFEEGGMNWHDYQREIDTLKRLEQKVQEFTASPAVAPASAPSSISPQQAQQVKQIKQQVKQVKQVKQQQTQRVPPKPAAPPPIPDKPPAQARASIPTPEEIEHQRERVKDATEEYANGHGPMSKVAYQYEVNRLRDLEQQAGITPSLPAPPPTRTHKPLPPVPPAQVRGDSDLFWQGIHARAQGLTPGWRARRGQGQGGVPPPPLPQGPVIAPDTRGAPPLPAPTPADQLASLRTWLTSGSPNGTIKPPSDEQLAFMQDPARKVGLEGGPGTGKTSTAVRRLMHGVAQGDVLPKNVLGLSALKSAASRIRGEYGQYQQYLPQGKAYQFMIPRTFASVAASTVLHAVNDPSTGKDFYPMLQKLGYGHLTGEILADPTAGELYGKDPQVAMKMLSTSRKSFIADQVNSYLTSRGKQPYNEFQMGTITSYIDDIKKGRGAPQSTYTHELAQGQQAIASGQMSNPAALALYEGAKNQRGLMDWDDLMSIAVEAYQKFGPDALPDIFKGVEAVLADEAQDVTPLAGTFQEEFYKALGPDTRVIASMDIPQSLTQGMGGIDLPEIRPTYRRMLGMAKGQAFHQLSKNFRSPQNIVDTHNNLLQSSKLAGMPHSSPQTSHSGKPGTPIQFNLTQFQPEQYRTMFHSMLSRTGVSAQQFKENYTKGLHPLTGASISPSQIAMIVPRNQDAKVFEKVGRDDIQKMLGVGPDEAGKVFHQIMRQNVPSPDLSPDDEEYKQAQMQMPLLKFMGSRGDEYLHTYMDASLTGQWAHLNDIKGHMLNLNVGMTRAKETLTVGASRFPFSRGKGEQYLGGKLDLEDAATVDKLTKKSGKNEFETYQGQSVPRFFRELLQEQSIQPGTGLSPTLSSAREQLRLQNPQQHAELTQFFHDYTGHLKADFSGQTYTSSPKQYLEQIQDLARGSMERAQKEGDLYKIVKTGGQHEHIGQLLSQPKSFATWKQGAPAPAPAPAPSSSGSSGQPQSVTVNTKATTVNIPPGGSLSLPPGVSITRSSTPPPAGSRWASPGGASGSGGSAPPTTTTTGPGFTSNPLGGPPPLTAQVTPPTQRGQSGNGGGGSGGSGGGGGGGGGMSAANFGRTMARIGYELQFIGQYVGNFVDQAIQQGSQYRQATVPLSGSGVSGTEGFYNFANTSGGISAYQRNTLPMYSTTQIAQGLHTFTGMTSYQGASPPLSGLTDIYAMAAMSGMDPTALMGPMAYLSGSSGQGSAQGSYTKLAGQLSNLFGGNLSQENLTPTLSALSGIVPTLQGLSPAGGPQTSQALAFFQLAQNAGLTSQNFGDVSQMLGGLSQVGSSPNLQQQYTLQRLGFPLTADTAYTQYQQEQTSRNMQMAQYGLMQNINEPMAGIFGGKSTGSPLSLPQLQIRIDRAQIQMDQANLVMSGLQLQQAQTSLQGSELQYQYGKASYGFNLAMNNALYGPIGQDYSKLAGYSFQQNQLVAQRSYTSPEVGVMFSPQNVSGLRNQEFYAGLQNQQQSLILGRSPLLADAMFQQQMKYIAQQADFYKQETALRNQQREFDMVWQKRLLDQQGAQVAAQAKIVGYQGYIYGLQQQQFKLEQQKSIYDQKQAQIQQQYLGQQAKDLAAINTAIQQFLQGQGPVAGKNLQPDQLVQNLANQLKSGALSPSALQGVIRTLVSNPADQKTLYQLVTQLAAQPKTLAQMEQGLNKTNDKQLLDMFNKLKKDGAFTSGTQQAGQQNAALQYGGTGPNWQNLSNDITNIANNTQEIAKALSSTSQVALGIATIANFMGPVAVGIGTIANFMGLFGGLGAGGGGLGGILGGLLGGGGGAGAGIAGAGAGGIGGLIGPLIAGTVLSAIEGNIGANSFNPQDPGQIPWLAAILGPTALTAYGGHALGDQITGGDHTAFSLPDTNDIFNWFKSIFGNPPTAHADSRPPDQNLPGPVPGLHAVTPAQQQEIYKLYANNKDTPSQAEMNQHLKGMEISMQRTQTSSDKTSSNTGIANQLAQVVANRNLAQDTLRTQQAQAQLHLQQSVADRNKTQDDLRTRQAQNFLANQQAQLKLQQQQLAQMISAAGGAHKDAGAIIKSQNDVPKNTAEAFLAALGVNGGSHIAGQAGNQGGTPVGHPGFTTPHVNAEFHQKMNYGVHQGVDFAAAQGTPIGAFNLGRVTRTGFFPWGGEVDVDIGNGLTERYLHLSQIGVQRGQMLLPRQRMGLTGGGTPASGFGYWSSGAHSHVQIDMGTYGSGIDPWPIWATMGPRDISAFYGAGWGTTKGSSGGSMGSGGGSTTVPKYHDGGIAMRRQFAELGDGNEPEAVVPLSRLQQVLKSVGQPTSGMQPQSSSSSHSSVSVQKLADKFEVHVHTTQSKLDDQATDDLADQVLAILNDALAKLTPSGRSL